MNVDFNIYRCKKPKTAYAFNGRLYHIACFQQYLGDIQMEFRKFLEEKGIELLEGPT